MKTNEENEFVLFQDRDTSLGGDDDLRRHGRGLLSLDLSSDSVEVPPALTGQPPSAVGVSLGQLQTLQSLQVQLQLSSRCISKRNDHPEVRLSQFIIRHHPAHVTVYCT